MTHMDEQVAKHIKEMIRRIRLKRPDNLEDAPKPDTLNQIVQILRKGPDRSYGLTPPARLSWSDKGPKT